MQKINKSILQFLSLSQSEIETLSKDILFMYHCNPQDLNHELLEDLDMYKRKEDLFLDESDSFKNGEFTPETDVRCLLEIFDYDQVLKSIVIEQHL